MPRCLQIGLLPVLFVVLVGAQSSPVITETEYLSVLNQNHPVVREATGAIAMAEARVLEAATQENPVLGAIREDPDGPVRQTELMISWQLPDAARKSEVKNRRQEVKAAKAHFTEQVLAHRLAMREAYASWAVASDRQRRLAAQATRVEALAERQAARAEKGLSSGLESHRLKLAANALLSRVAVAAVDRERTRAQAATWYPNLPKEARPVLPDLPDLLMAEGSPDRVGSTAQIQAAEENLAAARLARVAAGRFLRSPQVSVGWQRQEAESGSVGGPTFGLAWSVPVFDRKQAARASAEARIETAQIRLELIEGEVRASRDAARKSFEHLSTALDQGRQEGGINERMLDGAEAAFRLGEASLTDLLEIQRAVTEAELALLDLHEAALAAHREIERLAGLVPSFPQTHTENPTSDSPTAEKAP
ncbi:MAG: TolC family protein [Deltaproteobacteria bacterium]|nr:TolC family protein [Deltaproteobacteria bacterium]